MGDFTFGSEGVVGNREEMAAPAAYPYRFGMFQLSATEASRESTRCWLERSPPSSRADGQVKRPAYRPAGVAGASSRSGTDEATTPRP